MIKTDDEKRILFVPTTTIDRFCKRSEALVLCSFCDEHRDEHELVRTTRIFYEQWTTADAWAVHCSRSLLALSALIETVRLVSLSNKEWVGVLDDSEVRFSVWVRRVHFGVLGVLVIFPCLYLLRCESL